MSRFSLTEARVRRLLPTLAERPSSTRIDWIHPDPEPDVEAQPDLRWGGA